ncbi:MAG: hypothetical protein AAF634_02060 [Bacteroidota bacterium]
MAATPARYIDFFVYCNKRKAFCKSYNRLKKLRYKGAIEPNDYVKKLKSIHHSALELEIQYFHVLPMRL